ncbi:cytochrome c [Myxococcus llanfairpwllgwyngyllgogerychwyrndrobwllllantysiliogogogochensis]|uniref:Cytochrome c n=1 Tax=Myxococcus llanfairpwllgwyngyllgogerychwyrndrobwllllantysiliogogogochensis TaxID=2590453 RepID=A0A540WMA1_9BACT|nr:cytochrome c [Myxococcus llanfairpwllgwyngyllgogerychwyrndrobwllllantysiliogogogochensis]TQF10143.1 cytochrome c [Myxococcus llanfairpwllgwyngyllgogerychwyrndrobwllllantysiliogogogochensis]
MRKTWVGLAALGLAVGGCEQDETRPNFEYAPDMVASVPYDSFAPNPNTGDGKTLLTPAKGTVPRGHLPLHLLAGPDAAERAGSELRNPYPSSPEVVARGQTAFLRYCSPCHGAGGLGDGPVTARFSMPPSLLAEHAVGLPDGRIFHIITHGQGLMPAHGSQVAPEDRWKLVHYLRTLQNPARTARKETP